MWCQTDHLLSVRSGIRVLASLNLNSFVCPIFICSLWWGSKGFTNKAIPSNLQRTIIPIYLEGHYWSTLQTKDRKEGCWLQISSICLAKGRWDGAQTLSVEPPYPLLRSRPQYVCKNVPNHHRPELWAQTSRMQCIWLIYKGCKLAQRGRNMLYWNSKDLDLVPVLPLVG